MKTPWRDYSSIECLVLNNGEREFCLILTVIGEVGYTPKIPNLKNEILFLQGMSKIQISSMLPVLSSPFPNVMKPEISQRLKDMLGLFYQQLVFNGKIEDSIRQNILLENSEQLASDLSRLGNVELTYGMGADELVQLFLLPQMQVMLENKYPACEHQIIETLALYPNNISPDQCKLLIKLIQDLIRPTELEPTGEDLSSA